MNVVDDAALRRAIFEHAQDAMLLIDDDAIVLDANRAASDLFARPRSEVLGQMAAAFCVAEDRDGLERFVAILLSDGV